MTFLHLMWFFVKFHGLSEQKTLRFVLWRLFYHWVAESPCTLEMTPIGLDSRPGEWLILRSFFSPISHSLMGKPIPWYPMLPWWSLPLPSFTLISNSCETTTSGFSSWRFRGHTTKQLGKCVPASPSSPQTSSRHSFRFRFWGWLELYYQHQGLKISNSLPLPTKNSAECLHLHVCIYIHIDIYTYTRKNICTVALYI